MTSKTSKKVLLSFSGGLDSVVAAFLLQQQKYDVSALVFQTLPKDFAEQTDSENERNCHISKLDEIKDIAQSMGIQLYATSVAENFKSNVIDPLVAARLSGKYFSTCFECHALRFETLHKKAKELKMDYISTGHYAKVHTRPSGEVSIYGANDTDFDQSRLLSGVSLNIFKDALFPLGEIRNEEVLLIAQKYKLKYIEKDRARENCFFYNESLTKYIANNAHESLRPEASYYSLATETHLGDNDGIFAHYLGQKNLKSTSKLYPIDRNLIVQKLDMKSKEVILSPSEEGLKHSQCSIKKLKVSPQVSILKPMSCYAKSENKEFYKCFIIFKNNKSALIEFEEEIYNLSPGHVLTFFNKNTKNALMLGYGVVETFGNILPLDRTVKGKTQEELDLEDDNSAEKEETEKDVKSFQF